MNRRRYERSAPGMHWALKVGLVLLAGSILLGGYGVYSMGSGVAAVVPKAVTELKGNNEVRIPVKQERNLTIWQVAKKRDPDVVFKCVASSTGNPVKFEADDSTTLKVNGTTYLSMGSVSLSPGEYTLTSTGSAPGSVYSVNESLSDSVTKAGMGILGGIFSFVLAGVVGTVSLVFIIVGLIVGKKANPVQQ